MDDENEGHLAIDDQVSEFASYVFVLPEDDKDKTSRPKKKKKISHAAKVTEDQSAGFVPLLGGKEEARYMSARRHGYESTWAKLEKNFNEVLGEVNRQTVDDVMRFLTHTEPQQDTNQIPTGLVISGTSAGASTLVFSAVAQSLESISQSLIVPVAASQCTNLKTTLKHIILKATNQSIALADEDLPQHRQGVRLLNYDLQIVHEYVQKHSILRVVLWFHNCEGLDGVVLGNVVEVLSSWQGRIPFVLVLEIGTSIDLFQEKLSRATIRRLQGTSFEMKDAVETIEMMFRTATAPGESASLYIGAGLLKMFLDRQIEHIQSVHAFMQSLKYAFMTHFFANALSWIVHSSPTIPTLQTEHCEALRNLPSFRRLIENLMKEKQSVKAKALLDNDHVLWVTTRQIVEDGTKSMRHLVETMEVLNIIQYSIPSKVHTPWSRLYIKGLAGDLADSSILRETLLSVRKLPSNTMIEILTKVSLFAILDLDGVKTDLYELTRDATVGSAPLRSEYDVHHERLRTTVVAQKVQLSKHKGTLSKQDVDYSKIVDRIDMALKEFFEKYLISPKTLPLHEIFLFDLKSPIREVFAPVPRQAVERALSAPHDYLDCDCCDGSENGLAPSQPPTAILYQLYLESGAIINISDLWSAFNTILGPEDGDAEDVNDQETLAMFYRGLAELKFLGMIKNSRKKTDHLTKNLWKGL
ncbi:hypothetical protein MMC26_006733 [Xylographa opegraphella]|nr:hypothetical protein [Xylographa opegraphella]